MLNNISILVTGRTGSFGHSFVEMTLRQIQSERLVIFSRDEMKQWEMGKSMKMKIQVLFIGDVPR